MAVCETEQIVSREIQLGQDTIPLAGVDLATRIAQRGEAQLDVGRNKTVPGDELSGFPFRSRPRASCCCCGDERQCPRDVHESSGPAPLP